MENSEIAKEKSSTATLQLVKGEFAATQAHDIIMSLIDQKISYHNRESIQQWEKNHEADQTPIKARILELENEKKNAAIFLSKAKADGKKVKVDGQLNLRMLE